MTAKEYNKRSSEKLGWSPSWLGHSGITDELIEDIKDYQREHGLKADGKVGPITFKRLDEDRRLFNDSPADPDDDICTEEYIICDGQRVPIDTKVVTFDEDDKFYFAKRAKRNLRQKKPGTRRIDACIIHWDVTSSAQKTYKVLRSAGLSSHFCVDSDGTIYQYADPKDITFHCGKLNSRTIGIDINSLVYTKYAPRYVKKGLGRRPVITGHYHRRKKTILGYYDVQVVATMKLLKVLSDFYNIPMVVPMDENNNLLTTLHEPLRKKQWKGIACHYHLTKKKWDTAGFLESILEKDSSFFDDVEGWKATNPR